ncbi:uncharacterized protein LOC132922329 [Rhopalosiphum padi]|uniref:uncharacterized protein LOC132922329 n=1 Tax=Rhopalosiphum padi TaxID=40932 RepID=UPI00298DE8EE|nr:uncharacterized protein LOC132922329 [Rhopalosiphum padi]
MNLSNKEINSLLLNKSAITENYNSATPVVQNLDLKSSVKKKKERIIESGVKIMIINLYKSKIMEMQNQSNINYDDLMVTLSKCSGIKLRSIIEVVNEYRVSKQLKPVKLPERKSTATENSATPVVQNLDLKSSINKRKERIIESGEKIMIINLYKSKIMEMQNQSNINYDDLMVTLSKETEISLRSITEIVNEYRESKKIGHVKSPDRKRNRPIIDDKIDEFNKIAIRKKIHAFWLKREIPTLPKILQVIKNDPDLPNISQSHFYRVLKELNFKFTKRKQDRALTETEDLVVWRQNYIKDIRRYRSEGRIIYYLDEMSINVDDCIGDTLINRLSTGPKNPTAEGECLLAFHIGSIEGFVDGCLMCYNYKQKKNATNYCDEFISNIFYDWFCGVLPRLKDNCIIVMDNISYHSLKKEPIPTMDWKKENIIKWLVSKNCVVDKSIIKHLLMEKVNEIKPFHDKYLIDEEALKVNKVVLRLPPHHDELNPIELAWSMVKSHVKQHNTTCKLSDVKKLLSDGIQRITPEMWANFVSHTFTEEDKLYKIDFIVDEILDSVSDQIQTRDTSSDFSD